MLKTALLQISSNGLDQQANLDKGTLYCHKAKEMGADIALFPEMWNIGYELEHVNDIKDASITKDSNCIQHYKLLAQELNMAIAITYLEKNKSALLNSLSLIDRHGKSILHYSKVHTCDFGYESACTPGTDFFVCNLDTTQGDIKIGAMICYDREFPESARILMLKGAEVVLVPNSCELERNRIAQIQTRAFENMIGIAVTNYPHPKENGHSTAFDGMAFDQSEHSCDMLLVEADRNEGIFLAEFDIDQLRNYRQSETWGNSYRKPLCYKPLIDEAVRSPFIRNDAKR